MAEPTGLRARKKARTRRHIADTAARLFGERGYDAVAVTDVAREAEVAEQTVYNHFPTKVGALLDRLSGPARAAETLDVVAPESLTGDSIAQVWSDLLARPVVYGGDDPDGLERGMRTVAPSWMARDMRLMMERFERDGMVAAAGSDEAVRALLGRPMCTYAEFAAETAASWR